MTNKFHVGLIIDSTTVNKRIYDLVLLSKKSQYYKISHLILQNTNKNTENFVIRIWNYISRRGLKKLIDNVFFRILCKFESFFVRRNPKFKSFFDSFNLSDFNLKIINVEPTVSANKLVYRYNEIDLEKIKSLNLNLLVRGGSGILKGKILNICKNGIISFHHGDNDVIRGVPAGFWEVFNKEKKTGFIIQRLKEELDAGDVIYKGYIPTSFCYTLNLAMLYEKSNPFLHKIIESIVLKSSEINVYPKKLYSYPLYKTPSVHNQMQYLYSIMIFFLRKLFNK